MIRIVRIPLAVGGIAIFTFAPPAQPADEMKSDVLKDRTPVVTSQLKSATSSFTWSDAIPDNILGGWIDVAPHDRVVTYIPGPKTPGKKAT